MCRVLGLDFGERRIGVAISDPTHTIASPLTIIDREKVDAVDEIAKICKNYNVRRIVLGLPLLMSGKEGRVAKLVRRFKEELEKRIKIDVVLIDERLTSKISEKELRKKRKRIKKEEIDLFSAALLLQEYLMSHEGKNT